MQKQEAWEYTSEKTKLPPLLVPLFRCWGDRPKKKKKSNEFDDVVKCIDCSVAGQTPPPSKAACSFVSLPKKSLL